eukprot:325320-Karenia_brevis.AAC.1
MFAYRAKECLKDVHVRSFANTMWAFVAAGHASPVFSDAIAVMVNVRVRVCRSPPCIASIL